MSRYQFFFQITRQVQWTFDLEQIVIQIFVLSLENGIYSNKPSLINLGPVVERIDNTFQRKNRYRDDDCWENVQRDLSDKDLTSG